MNITGVIEELKKKYPGKKILLNNRQNCTEILCETDPAGIHPSHSEVISVMDKTDSHYHDQTTEIYTVIKGVLTLIVDGKKYILNDGQSYTIGPGQVHEAIGNETWVKCVSKPGWKKSDHHITK
ncbi:MAG: cupin domain-containing protein [bacterium]